MAPLVTAERDVDELDEVFGALANASRRAILDRLRRGEATVTELAEPLDLSLPAVSRHLKVLESAGLISRGQRAQFRPCAIEAGPLRDAAGWMADYRPIWEGRLDRLAERLAQADTDGGTDP